VNSIVGASKRRRRLLTPGRLASLLFLLALALVAPQLRSGTELVRVRNALTLGPDITLDDQWSPPAYPADFRREPLKPDPFFTEVARRLELQALPDDWARTQAISRHLLSAPHRSGGEIQQDLDTTYRLIAEDGDGYCGDFVRAFTAIANAAGMVVRPWAFSFDGFGGHGHIWVEVWNRQRQSWQLADVFQNYYFTAGDDRPLSAAELYARMAGPADGWQLHPLVDGVPPGWAVEAKARDYLVRGRAQWFAPWGNNVIEVDRNPVVQWAGVISRSAEGLAAIATGVQPRVRLLATDENAAERDGLRALRVRLVLAAAALLAAFILAVAALWQGWRCLKRPGPGAAADGAGPQAPTGTTEWPRVCLVGPLPPPSGGMANQCEQLLRMLHAEGVPVELVRTNAPCFPAWAERVPVLRAVLRLWPYLVRVWGAAGRAQVVHLLANSGWAWHLFAAPVLWIARVRGVPVIVNYRGGLAASFLDHAPRRVHRALRGAALRVTPSAFLRRVFDQRGFDAEVIPNIVDLDRFTARPWRAAGDAPHIVVARNLEPLYGLPTALQALALLRRQLPQATMSIAGSGPQEAELRALAQTLGLAAAVRFPGRIDHAAMPALYAGADLALNPSTVDNMPNSVLEAFASGVPMVSTDVGGVPDIVEHGVHGLLVPVGDAEAMAAAMARVLSDGALAQRLAAAGQERVQAWGWARVRAQWQSAYRRAAAHAGARGARGLAGDASAPSVKGHR